MQLLADGTIPVHSGAHLSNGGLGPGLLGMHRMSHPPAWGRLAPPYSLIVCYAMTLSANMSKCS